ncbi:MAG: hypothetical protein ACK4PI_09475 [Tepidisphaerales bacterium]
MVSRHRHHRLIRAWRGSPLAPLIVLALLSAGGPLACAAAGSAAARAEAGGAHARPDPSRFRQQLDRLLSSGRYDEAERLLRLTAPQDLAIAASERADIQYMHVVTFAPPPASLPGLEPHERPARVRTYRLDDADPAAARLLVHLRGFAAEYNRTLAREERGVR